MAGCTELLCRAKPYVAMISLQFGYAGMNIITKVSLTNGMSHYVLVVYRHAFATLSIAPFALILERYPTIHQNPCPFSGLLLNNALFLTQEGEAGDDQVGVFADFRTGIARVGSYLTILLIFASFYYEVLTARDDKDGEGELKEGDVPGKGGRNSRHSSRSHGDDTLQRTHSGDGLEPARQFWCIQLPADSRIKQQGMASGFHLSHPRHLSLGVSAVTLKQYSAQLSLTTWICFVGTLQAIAVTLVMEHEPSVWSIGFDMNLLAAAYAGIVTSSVAYYVQGLVIEKRGPVFASAFSPLMMIIVAILGSFILNEKIYLGGVVGGVLIVLGLYSVLWGKYKENKEKREMEAMSLPLALQESRGCQRANRDIETSTGV
ncbi:hypothetical protein ZIOFF_027355 [Zingiber officinale]|uniref:WAT1-related protein n=1 Tax=Zingiber officinale TaxID=94328 RepID=A0A8J5LDU9_ZINOF|nr:hypothetical protein ZIOFF_027355 [Zingiber officinale]